MINKEVIIWKTWESNADETLTVLRFKLLKFLVLNNYVILTVIGYTNFFEFPAQVSTK